MPKGKFWIYTVLLSLLICGAGLGELMIRRQTPASMYLLNKSLACTAILLITLSYVLSAVHSFWQVPRSILLYRRYTGLVGYGYVLLHLVATFLTPSTSVPDASQFPFPDYFIERPVAFIAATIGFGIFTYAFWMVIGIAALLTWMSLGGGFMRPHGHKAGARPPTGPGARTHPR